jgi:lipoate-protein ligase A
MTNLVWRLIPLRSTSKVQMAIDSWLLKQHQLGLHPATLRFLHWSPPAIYSDTINLIALNIGSS